MRRALRASVALATLALLLASGSVASTATPPGLDVFPRVGIRGTPPGRIVEEIISVVNLSKDADYDVAATIEDLAVDSAGKFSSIPAESGLPSAAAWGVVEPKSFLLPHGHTQTVRLAFKPPAGTEPRGYYASVNFVGSSAQGGSSRVTHAVLLEVQGATVLRAGDIAGISARSVSVGSTAQVTLRLENSGNVYAIAQGRVTVRDAFSRVVAVVTVANIPVIPGTTRILTVDVPTPLIPGRLRVSTDLGFGPGVPRDQATTTFYAFAWWHVGVGVVLLLVVLRMIFGLLRRRYRRRRARRKKKAEEESLAPVPVTVELPQEIAADLQSSWEPAEAPEPPRRPVLKVVPPPPPLIAAPPAPPPAAEPEPEPEPEPMPEAPPRPKPELEAELEPEPEHAPPAAEPESDFWSPPVVVPSDSSWSSGLPAAEDADDIDLWPEPRVIPRPKQEEPAIEEPEPVAESAPEKEPELVEPVLPPVVVAPRPLLSPSPPPAAVDALPVGPEPAAVEPKPAPVPAAIRERPAPVVEPVVFVATASSPVEVEVPDPASARAEKLSALVKAGIPAGPPAGREAASRRVKVAIDMLGSGSGKSGERIDVAMQIIASAGDAGATGAVEKAFEDAASTDRPAAMGSLAMALVRLDSPRAPEALLRAYAVSPRAGYAMLRDTLKKLDPAVLKAQSKLIAELPEDRRAALKLG